MWVKKQQVPPIKINKLKKKAATGRTRHETTDSFTIGKGLH